MSYLISSGFFRNNRKKLFVDVPQSGTNEALYCIVTIINLGSLVSTC